MDLNKVTLIGNMVREPESSSTRTGQRVVRFTLATSYAWRDAKIKAKKEAVDFHDIIAWGKLGDIIRQYVKRGSKVYIEGRLRKRGYVTKDGQRRFATEIVADNMILLGHRTAKIASQAVKDDGEVADALVKDDVDVEDIGEGTA